jgi:hypothetical protein
MAVSVQPSRHFTGQENLRPDRQLFRHPRSSMGGHWIKTAGLLIPLGISEFIKDPDQKWRAMRAASILMAVLYQASWAHKINEERKERSEWRER